MQKKKGEGDAYNGRLRVAAQWRGGTAARWRGEERPMANVWTLKRGGRKSSVSLGRERRPKRDLGSVVLGPCLREGNYLKYTIVCLVHPQKTSNSQKYP